MLQVDTPIRGQLCEDSVQCRYVRLVRRCIKILLLSTKFMIVPKWNETEIEILELFYF